MCERPDQVQETFRERPEAQSSRNLSAAVVLLKPPDARPCPEMLVDPYALPRRADGASALQPY